MPFTQTDLSMGRHGPGGELTLKIKTGMNIDINHYRQTHYINVSMQVQYVLAVSGSHEQMLQSQADVSEPY